MDGVVGVELRAPKAGALVQAQAVDVVRASVVKPPGHTVNALSGQFPDTDLTYPHGQRPVTGENR